MSSQACASVCWGQLAGSHLSGDWDGGASVRRASGMPRGPPSAFRVCLPSILTTPSEVGRAGVGLKGFIKIPNNCSASY